MTTFTGCGSFWLTGACAVDPRAPSCAGAAMTQETEPSVAAILDRVWSLTGLDPTATAAVELIGAEPVLSSSFRVDALAQAAVAAQGPACLLYTSRCV